MKSRTAGYLLTLSAMTFAWPRVASAAHDLEVSGTSILGGSAPLDYNRVVVKSGGTLRVQGMLHLRATSIVVESGGRIDATGQGFQGMDNLDGAGEMSGGGKHPAMSGPGGGGANELHGGSGTNDSGCAVAIGSTGGIGYGDHQSPKPGSAGGAANVATPGLGSRGGHGGGVIILEAALVQVFGELLAGGEDGLIAQGSGSGGGAGGAIQIIANVLESGASTRLSVRGGTGGDGTTNGGGGSGGLIVLVSNMPAGLTTDITGGASGSCTMTPAGRGGTGTLFNPGPPADCLDIDGDGSPSLSCPTAGADCDDADPTVLPGAVEGCNGIDDDCNGLADDNLAPDACLAGQTCENGACTAMPVEDAGADASPVEPSPSSITFRGGCALGHAPGPADAVFLAAAGLGLLARGRCARPGKRRAARARTGE